MATPSLNDLINRFGGLDTSLPATNFNKLPALNEVNALRQQQAKLAQLADNPESDIGTQRTLQGIQTGLTRSQQAAIGAAKGRAATSGQAGFAGALAGSAAAIQANKDAAYAQTAAQLFGDLSKTSRNQALDLSKTILTAEQAQAQLANQRAQIDQQSALAELTAKLQQQGNLLSAATSARGQDITESTANQNLDLQRKQLEATTASDAKRLGLSEKELNVRTAEIEQQRKAQELAAALDARRVAIAEQDAKMRQEELKRQQQQQELTNALQAKQFGMTEKEFQMKLKQMSTQEPIVNKQNELTLVQLQKQLDELRKQPLSQVSSTQAPSATDIAFAQRYGTGGVVAPRNLPYYSPASAPPLALSVTPIARNYTRSPISRVLTRNDN